MNLQFTRLLGSAIYTLFIMTKIAVVMSIMVAFLFILPSFIGHFYGWQWVVVFILAFLFCVITAIVHQERQ